MLRYRLSLDEGRFLVKLARETIQAHLSGQRPRMPEPPTQRLKEERGAFVSLYRHPVKELRGCIGFPLPTKPLIEAVVDASIASATQDPRFQPVSLDELSSLIIEVSVLSLPEEIGYKDPKELPEKIVIGRDGLIIRAGAAGGLLLPQVPLEYGWSPEEFLMHLCLKAGLPSTYWLTGKAQIFRFSAQVFAEREPGGEVIEEELEAKKC